MSNESELSVHSLQSMRVVTVFKSWVTCLELLNTFDSDKGGCGVGHGVDVNGTCVQPTVVHLGIGDGELGPGHTEAIGLIFHQT